MKKLILNLLVIFILVVVVVGCGKKQQPMDLYDSIKQRGKIVIGVEKDIRPFSFTGEDGTQQGFEIDIAKLFAKAIMQDENAIEFVFVEPSNRISMLNSGQADMIIATMTITNARKDVIDFSDPYYFAGQTVLVNRNSNIKTLKDLNDKRIGVTFGTTAVEGIKSVVPGGLIQGYKTYLDAYNALKSGEIDAFSSDDTVLREYEIKDKSVVMLPQKYTQEQYGVAFRKGTESVRTIDTVNTVIKMINTNGTMNQLKNKWFKK